MIIFTLVDVLSKGLQVLSRLSKIHSSVFKWMCVDYSWVKQTRLQPMSVYATCQHNIPFASRLCLSHVMTCTTTLIYLRETWPLYSSTTYPIATHGDTFYNGYFLIWNVYIPKFVYFQLIQ